MLFGYGTPKSPSAVFWNGLLHSDAVVEWMERGWKTEKCA
jgi:hypothetical protein